MQATTPPSSLPELKRDEGLCLYGLGRLTEASEALASYLSSQPDPQDLAVVVALLEKIRERTASQQQQQQQQQE